MTEQDHSGENPDSRPLLINEVRGCYGSRWILGQVVNYDHRGEPLHINVITASRGREKISKVLAKLRSTPSEESLQGPYCIFHTKPMSGLRFRVAKAVLGL